jgi:exosortase/archaeosortase family protein
MKFWDIITYRKLIIFTVSLFILLSVYIILRLIFFDTDPLIPFLISIKDSYILLSEKFANLLFCLTGSPAAFDNQLVGSNGIHLNEFVGTIRFISFKKWLVLLILLVWVTRSSTGKKLLFTFLLVIVHFLLISIYFAAGAYLNSIESQNYSFLSIPITIGKLSMLTLFFIWYRIHKAVMLSGLTRLKIKTSLFEKDFRVIVIAYMYVIFSNLVLEIFDFGLWIDFLFSSAQKILTFLGVKAIVEPFYLIGTNGSIYMAKGCLGFETMLLFAVLVYLTGNSNKLRWIYIFAGLLFLNFVNILRFVLLFIYIQKHGDYNLAMDVHSMYNYVIYIIIFVLWIIWFEKFADSKPKGKSHQ